ncbi:hypothetical protein B0O99DRAFT_614179 [Bisporella sp. PMI_857]|nr:hypothetical protein B0O99DRAFT_614179 [Bisporella sp. PMI_857]
MKTSRSQAYLTASLFLAFSLTASHTSSQVVKGNPCLGRSIRPNSTTGSNESLCHYGNQNNIETSCHRLGYLLRSQEL